MMNTFKREIPSSSCSRFTQASLLPTICLKMMSLQEDVIEPTLPITIQSKRQWPISSNHQWAHFKINHQTIKYETEEMNEFKRRTQHVLIFSIISTTILSTSPLVYQTVISYLYSDYVSSYSTIMVDIHANHTHYISRTKNLFSLIYLNGALEGALDAVGRGCSPIHSVRLKYLYWTLFNWNLLQICSQWSLIWESRQLRLFHHCRRRGNSIMSGPSFFDIHSSSEDSFIVKITVHWHGSSWSVSRLWSSWFFWFNHQHAKFILCSSGFSILSVHADPHPDIFDSSNNNKNQQYSQVLCIMSKCFFHCQRWAATKWPECETASK